MKLRHVALVAVFAWAVVAGALAQSVRPPTPSPQPAAPADPRILAIETELRSKDDAQISAACDTLRQWFAQNAQDADREFYRNRTAFHSLATHAQEVLDLVELDKAYKKSVPHDVGAVYIMQVNALYQLNKPDSAEKAMAAYRESIKVDPVRTSKETATFLAGRLTTFKAYEALATMLDLAVTAYPDDPATVEANLKARIKTLNTLKRYDDALIDAKKLFNVSTMEHTADAIKLIDEELLLAKPDNPDLRAQFRKEQNEGAVAPSPRETPKTSGVLLGIKIDPAPYDEAITAGAGNGVYGGLVHSAALLLLADKPADAIPLAEQARDAAYTSPKATAVKDRAAAIDLIARCYKAQDGTIGRANAFIASQASGASASPAAPTPLPQSPNTP